MTDLGSEPENPYADIIEASTFTAPPDEMVATTLPATAASAATTTSGSDDTNEISPACPTIDSDLETQSDEKDVNEEIFTLQQLRPVPRVMHIGATLLLALFGLVIFAFASVFFSMEAHVLGGLAVFVGILQVSESILGFIVAAMFHEKAFKICHFVLSIILVLLYLWATVLAVIQYGESIQRGFSVWGVRSEGIILAISLVSLIIAVILIVDLLLLLLPASSEIVFKQERRNYCG